MPDQPNAGASDLNFMLDDYRAMVDVFAATLLATVERQKAEIKQLQQNLDAADAARTPDPAREEQTDG